MDNEERMDFWIDAERSLTADEFRILRMLADGYTCEDVAGMSTFSRRTAYRRKLCVVKKVAEMWHKTL